MRASSSGLPRLHLAQDNGGCVQREGIIDAEKASLRPRSLRAIDRRFPKRHPAIEAMYPGHFLPSSPQMLEELLRRSLELERSLRQQPLIVSRAA